MIKNFSQYICESFKIYKDDAGKSKSEFPDQKGDCAIRVTCISFNKEYNKVHQEFSKIGDIKSGFDDSEMISVWKKLGIKHKSIDVEKIKLVDFIKKYPKGNFILSYRNHFTNLIDGNLYDIDKSNSYFKREYIYHVYKPL